MTAQPTTPEKPKVQEVLDLSTEASAWLFELLEKPANEPTEEMLRAAERCRELFGK